MMEPCDPHRIVRMNRRADHDSDGIKTPFSKRQHHRRHACQLPSFWMIVALLLTGAAMHAMAAFFMGPLAP